MKGNFVLNYFGKNKLCSELQLFMARRFTPLILMFFLVFGHHITYAQNFCYFDEVHGQQMNSDFESIFLENEIIMQQQMLNNPQAIMNNTVYSVPVVFHVIHLGEAQGSGSNIPTSAIDATLQQLNDHYRDVLNVGYDVKIEFCLAERDPNGNSHSGINRVDGRVISSYASFGINSVNEEQVKALSIWPNGDCINIWVVHNIVSPPGSSILGYATFPGTSASIDGIVMRSGIVGSSSESGIISHEMGHFFSLYHTFQGSSGFSSCPNNIDCGNDGDKCCDTKAHPYMNQQNNWFPCIETQYNSCDPGNTIPYMVTQNHMNYTSNSCRDEFTPEQTMRMRCALMDLRPGLINSLCCYPGCTSAVANFTYTTLNVNVGGQITFTNTSTGADTYLWTVEGNNFNSENLTYQFNNYGLFDVCLTVENEDCINQKCVTIEVSCRGLPPCDVIVGCDNLVKNGDFALNCVGQNSSDLKNGSVCNWRVKRPSPRFCSDINGANTMVLADWDEAIVTTEPVPLNPGSMYKLTFEYYRVNHTSTFENSELSFGFDANPTSSEMYPFSNYELINTLENSSMDQVGLYNDCYGINDVEFHQYVYKFTYSGNIPSYLFFNYRDFGNNSASSFIQIRNVQIMCCDEDICSPEPSIEYDINCPKEFVGSNSNPDDGDDYLWTFSCTQAIYHGQEVSLDLPAGDCEVCLTIGCDLETSVTICETVTVPAETPECQDLCTDIKIYPKACAQDIETENTFIANVMLTVPDGTKACDGADIISTSINAAVNITSMDIRDDGNMDIIAIGLEITTAVGFDLLSNGSVGVINLCDPEGNVICYNVIFSATSCKNCLGEVTATAACVDTDPLDDIYSYSGSVTLTLDPGIYSLCSSQSTEVGYTHNVTFDPVNSTATVNFTINTNKEGDFDVSTLLCISRGSEEFCFTLNIDIQPCPPIPDNCVEWGTKVAEATNCRVANGVVTYNVNMSNVWLFDAGYNDCGNDLIASLNGSQNITLNSSSISNDGEYLSYQSTITMPCGFNTSQIYELIIYGCDIYGNPACFSFNISFPDCDAECGERGNKNTENRTVISNNNIDVKIYPNPTDQKLNVEIFNTEVSQYTVQIIDQLGRVAINKEFETKTIIETQSLSTGIHFVKISKHSGELIRIEKLIILR
ncbi:MAG TPA: M43 family zinc metalloprotease [Saprospiraceae bacterium]|nr:M43 family zinc metalloprotease [Saprospiraceae bacterium]